ncbi:MAG: TonB family protein [Candidatus Poribacteria bacterium]|nr:TonB family protein [Candidatus Poribacteria bacterium]
MPLLISAGLHLIALAAGVFNVFVVHAPDKPEDAVSVEFVRLDPPKRPTIRRQMTRALDTSRMTAPTTASVSVNLATAVDLPAMQGEYVLAAGTSSGFGIMRGGFAMEPHPTPARDLTVAAISLDARPFMSPRVVAPPMPESATVQTRFAELSSPSDINPTSAMTQPPRFRFREKPSYPESARRAQIEGAVVLQAEVHPDGTARNVVVVQGLGYGCDEAAVRALTASRFDPAARGDQSAIASVRVTYRFELKGI